MHGMNGRVDFSWLKVIVFCMSMGTLVTSGCAIIIGSIADEWSWVDAGLIVGMLSGACAWWTLRTKRGDLRSEF